MGGVKSLVTGLKQAYLVAILSGVVAACGGNDGLKINKETSPKTNGQQPGLNGDTGLALAMPANLPTWVDTVHVTLEQVVAGDSGTCSSTSSDGKLLGRPCLLQQNIVPALAADFTLNGKPIRINDLAQGEYMISVSTLNAKTGRVHSQGDGSVTIKAGQVATAHITMTQVGYDNGSLIIVLDDGQSIQPMPPIAPPIAPLNCALPAMIKPPVCVSVGKPAVYRLQDYIVNRQNCRQVLPIGVQQVDAKFCQSPQIEAVGG